MFNSWLPITRIKIFGAGILYKATTLFAGKEKRIIEREGVKYEVDLAEGIELSMFLFGKFQSHITKNPFLRLPADGVVIDIGANVGLMSLQFAKMVPAGRVYSFEPTHYALERLKRNLELKESQDYTEAILETMHGPLMVLSANLQVRKANTAFYQTFQLTPERTEGSYLYDLGVGAWDIPALLNKIFSWP